MRELLLAFLDLLSSASLGGEGVGVKGIEGCGMYTRVRDGLEGGGR
jgi:hypothetical protein